MSTCCKPFIVLLPEFCKSTRSRLDSAKALSTDVFSTLVLLSLVRTLASCSTSNRNFCALSCSCSCIFVAIPWRSWVTSSTVGFSSSAETAVLGTEAKADIALTSTAAAMLASRRSTAMQKSSCLKECGEQRKREERNALYVGFSPSDKHLPTPLTEGKVPAHSSWLWAQS